MLGGPWAAVGAPSWPASWGLPAQVCQLAPHGAGPPSGWCRPVPAHPTGATLCWPALPAGVALCWLTLQGPAAARPLACCCEPSWPQPHPLLSSRSFELWEANELSHLSMAELEADGWKVGRLRQR